MSHRNRRHGRSARAARPTLRTVRPQHSDEPDLLAQIGAALTETDPLPLLALASSLLAVVDHRGRNPFDPPDVDIDRDALLESFFAVRRPETTALLAALAGLSGDDVLRGRVHREVVERAHPLPGWLADLATTEADARAVEVTHVLGDGENVLVAATLPGGHPVTAVVYVDHNMGTLVKDAFVLPEPIEDVLDALHGASEGDPDMTAKPLDAADARARIDEAVQLSAISHPPPETDSWPACRALVEWIIGLLPGGGEGYDRPEWDGAALDGLARRFRVSRFGRGLDDPADLLSVLLSLGADYAPNDPLRASPVSVEVLLLDRIPRKVIAPVTALAGVPDLLRAFVRFCHHERGVRPALTEQTVAAVDDCEPEYQRMIRDERSQGPAAMLADLGAFDDLDDEFDLDAAVADTMLDAARRAVGGDAALDALDTDPLPDEPFAWAAVPPDVHTRVGEVLDLIDRCCTELLDAEYRTACRRLLVDVAAGDPDIFRRRGRAATAAATICWLAGKANSLFEREPSVPTLAVKDLTAHFGVSGGSVSQRSEVVLRAIDVSPDRYGHKDLGTPRYLTGLRRAQILALRDRYRHVGEPR